LWLAAAAALTAGAYAYWSLSSSRAAVTYVTVPVRGNLTVLVTAAGSAQPITQVNISSEPSGTVRRVLVDHNTEVTAGQVLAELDMDRISSRPRSTMLAKLAASKAKVAETAATILERRALYKRRRTLDPDVVPDRILAAKQLVAHRLAKQTDGTASALALVWGPRSQATYFTHSPLPLLPSYQFLCSTWNPVSSPRPTRVGGRRAQGLSRSAVALAWRHAPAFPGRALTAPSTAARLLWSG
jgi:pyruvate/2-oxoglutarate dehydrogenase complex dihydrolipoamide acyltransferase (E2) component